VEVHISLEGGKDVGASIYWQLRKAILEGRLRPGDPLPPTRDLARRLNIARGTVSRAYDQLWGEGFVVSRVGAGTFVSEHVPQAPPDGVTRQPVGPLRPREVWDSIRVPAAFAREGRFDFRTGLPDTSLFPYETWRRLMAEQLRRDAPGRGVYAHPAGHEGLRRAIARHIGVSRGVQAVAEDVVICNGTQQALDVIARTLLGPGETIAVEDPGYTPPRMLFQSLGLDVRPVRVDADGLVVDELPAGTRVVYVTPSHQYPLSLTMTLQRRLALLDWAERNDAAIIEDDYDSEFRFGGRPIEPIQTLDTSGRVIYVGSFSKTLLPALRLGFIATPPSLRRAIYAAKYVADWHSPLPAQAVLARFIEDGDFARHLRRMRSVYEKRRNLILATLHRDFREFLEVIPSAAGLHLTALAVDAQRFDVSAGIRRASELGVEVHDLSRIGAGAAAMHGVMLGYGAVATDEIAEGLALLRGAFEAAISPSE
jgi:GntR family transcriptional regulator/MocR family aminotransferase